MHSDRSTTGKTYHIDLSKGTLSALDNQLLYRLLTDRAAPSVASDSKIRRKDSYQLFVGEESYQITLSHSLLPQKKTAEEEVSVFLLLPLEKLGEGSEGKIKRPLFQLRLNHEKQSVQIEAATSKVKIKRTLISYSLEHDQLKKVEPDTTFHPVFGNKKLYLISKFHDGITLLDAFLEHRIHQPITLLKNLAIQLNYLHERGLLHQDLKLDNIIVNPETNEVALIDLGTAKEIGSITGETGNPYYRPPEKRRILRATTDQDLYGFGILAYQILVNNPNIIPPHIYTYYQTFIPPSVFEKGEIISGDLAYLASIRTELKDDQVCMLWDIIKSSSNLNPYKRKKFPLTSIIEVLNRLEQELSATSLVAPTDERALPNSYEAEEVEDYTDIAEEDTTFDELYRITTTNKSEENESVQKEAEEETTLDALQKLQAIATNETYWNQHIHAEDKLALQALAIIRTQIKDASGMIILLSDDEAILKEKLQFLYDQVKEEITHLQQSPVASTPITNTEILSLLKLMENVAADYSTYVSAIDSYFQRVHPKGEQQNTQTLTGY